VGSNPTPRAINGDSQEIQLKQQNHAERDEYRRVLDMFLSLVRPIHHNICPLLSHQDTHSYPSIYPPNDL
jgi:hypothetical protein